MKLFNPLLIDNKSNKFSWNNIEKMFGGDLKNSMSEHIHQGKVLLQTYHNLCGYHTYYNMRNTIESLITDDPVDKVYYHLRNKDKIKNWH